MISKRKCYSTRTFHMCPKKYWFTIYKSINSDLVLIENDVAYKIIGIGTIKSG